MEEQYQVYGTTMSLPVTWAGIHTSSPSPTPVPLPQKSEDSDTLGVFFIVAAIILIGLHYNRRKDPDHDDTNRPA